MKEIWKTIEKFSDYSISNIGNIKRIKKDKFNRRLKNLKPRTNKYGYLQINLYKDLKRYTRLIHRLVKETFDPIENMEHLEINHKNGIKNDNRKSNLEWNTTVENINHASKMNLSYRGEKNGNSKLTEEDIIEIWKYFSENISQKEIAKKFNISSDMISKIKNKRNWTDVRKEEESELLVNALQCQNCKDIIFSRARHDFRSCTCGETYVDGGFSYTRIGYKDKIPKTLKLKISTTRKQLYDDWNYVNKKDKYGLLKKGRKRKWVKEIIK